MNSQTILFRLIIIVGIDIIPMQFYCLCSEVDDFYNLLFPFSGGGSALLPAPIPPITLSELLEITRLLSFKGATVQQLNTIRKHLELLKAGGLAKAAYPAPVRDVIHNL